MHRKNLGTLGEALVIAQLLAHDLTVFQEVGDNSKVDLIVLDSSHHLHKVQVKCFNRDAKRPEVTSVPVTKSGPNYRFAYQADMIDWFAVVDNETKKIAWINAAIALAKYTSTITLRHGGGQSNSSHFDDYTAVPFK